MTTETNNTNAIKPRRWFRFRLRTLLVMVTLLSIPLGWVGWELDQRRKEKKVIAWVEQMGGFVQFDYGRDAGLFNGKLYDERSWWEKTKDKWLGERVHFVILKNTQVSDLSPLAEWKNLEMLWLWDTQVSDLSPLSELKKLKSLNLRNTQVSEEQVEKLRLALPNCKIHLID
jgi:Leucine-rich repeat (LRR) protein